MNLLIRLKMLTRLFGLAICFRKLPVVQLKNVNILRSNGDEQQRNVGNDRSSIIEQPGRYHSQRPVSLLSLKKQLRPLRKLASSLEQLQPFEPS